MDGALSHICLVRSSRLMRLMRLVTRSAKGLVASRQSGVAAEAPTGRLTSDSSAARQAGSARSRSARAAASRGKSLEVMDVLRVCGQNLAHWAGLIKGRIARDDLSTPAVILKGQNMRPGCGVRNAECGIKRGDAQVPPKASGFASSK